MNENNQARVAIVIPAGPGKESLLDTLHSVIVFCPENHAVFVVDDHTTDGTYEALLNAKQPHWEVFRNEKSQGVERLVHTLCLGFERVLRRTKCQLILRLDQDALIIKPGLIADAFDYMRKNPQVGLFGVYEADYNRPRSYEAHRKLISQETAWYRRLIGKRPSWEIYLAMAERNGYQRGDNVFGGAYFMTRSCLEAVDKMGALNVPWHWNSRMQEDVYFSMITIAAGYKLGHFAAPDGPLCMEWRGLPYPADTLATSKFKLVHSVDKGKNTGAADNGGRTAREVFREVREKWALAGQSTPSKPQSRDNYALTKSQVNS